MRRMITGKQAEQIEKNKEDIEELQNSALKLYIHHIPDDGDTNDITILSTHAEPYTIGEDRTSFRVWYNGIVAIHLYSDGDGVTFDDIETIAFEEGEAKYVKFADDVETPLTGSTFNNIAENYTVTEF